MENGTISAEDIPKIFNDSIISLNFANSNGENQIKARVFEVTGSGGFLLTEDAKNLNKVFMNDEIVIYENIEDCAKKIKYFLQNFKKREEIVKKSFEKISKNYTYANKLHEILEKVDKIKKQTKKSINFQNIIKKHKKN